MERQRVSFTVQSKERPRAPIYCNTPQSPATAWAALNRSQAEGRRRTAHASGTCSQKPSLPPRWAALAGSWSQEPKLNTLIQDTGTPTGLSPISPTLAFWPFSCYVSFWVSWVCWGHLSPGCLPLSYRKLLFPGVCYFTHPLWQQLRGLQALPWLTPATHGFSLVFVRIPSLMAIKYDGSCWFKLDIIYPAD